MTAYLYNPTGFEVDFPAAEPVEAVEAAGPGAGGGRPEPLRAASSSARAAPADPQRSMSSGCPTSLSGCAPGLGVYFVTYPPS